MQVLSGRFFSLSLCLLNYLRADCGDPFAAARASRQIRSKVLVFPSREEVTIDTEIG